LTSVVPEDRAVPPDAAEYHCIEVPVAVRFETVGAAAEQNDWVAVPVGAAGLLRVTVTASLELLSQPASVWLA
jgi:hypothetical protein